MDELKTLSWPQFPLTVMRVGTTWRVFNCLTGLTSPEFQKYEDAAFAAHFDRNLYMKKEQQDA